jgi:hypothetical protein
MEEWALLEVKVEQIEDNPAISIRMEVLWVAQEAILVSLP